ncbi:hypothetical protein QR680_008969 [Steinernema hermaphroditum]|uniref:STAS domain-containing protein n=1 Tax=Steinernema hermaphroditum TaxID=289476 RepID=A0AA39IK23_9BILA|nr:hypothetical protein QR680_008969 [Steinernema hermaphroditum]
MDEEKKLDFAITVDSGNREFEESLEDLRPEGGESFEGVVRKNLKKHFEACTSAESAAEKAVGFVPILTWLPKYPFGEYFIYDVMGGITTGVMHLPQGIAYAILSGVHPIYGLYSSFFPPLFYMLFGTSHHVSIGSFSVVALMTGIANDKLMTKYASMGDAFELSGIEVVTTLTFTLGLCQLFTALLRLEFLTAYFSDALVAGFTTASAIHVFAAQIDDILGIALPKSAGPGYLFRRAFDLLIRLPETNAATFALSACAMIILYFGKEYFSPLVDRLLPVKVPIPYELIVTVLATVACFCLDLDTAYNVPIVGEIPTGLAPPTVPRMDIFFDCLANSIGIAIVTIAIHISMAKMLARTKNYEIDESQELYALSFTSILSSFFSVYPMSTALGRTMVMVESGTRTQLSSVFSSALVLVVILWLGPLFRTLPMCLLASVIIMALRSMFLKFSDLPRLWRISKYDFFIWVVSFSATCFIDVMEGLFVSIVFAILTVVFRTQWPRWHVLSPTKATHSVCVFRFESPLLFTNVENFKKSLRKALLTWNLHNPGMRLEYLVFDCSAISYIDVMGANALKEMCQEIVEKELTVFVAGAKVGVKEVLGASSFFKTVSTDFFLPSVGAVAEGIKMQKKLAASIGNENATVTHGETEGLVTAVPNGNGTVSSEDLVTTV